MNIQNSWRWLKGTRQGRFVLLLVAFLLVLYFVSVRMPVKKVKPDNRAISAKSVEPATKAEGYRLKSDIPLTAAAFGPTPSPTPYPRPFGHTSAVPAATFGHASTFADAHLRRGE